VNEKPEHFLLYQSISHAACAHKDKNLLSRETSQSVLDFFSGSADRDAVADPICLEPLLDLALDIVIVFADNVIVRCQPASDWSMMDMGLVSM
jgi:hypothetical protein